MTLAVKRGVRVYRSSTLRDAAKSPTPSASPSQNTTAQPDEHILNAQIQKLLFNNTVTLALSAQDILGQSKNLMVSDSSNIHSETTNNTLGRYIILSVSYRFGSFGRNRGGRGPGMGGPGMGGPGMGGPGGGMPMGGGRGMGGPGMGGGRPM